MNGVSSQYRRHLILSHRVCTTDSLSTNIRYPTIITNTVVKVEGEVSSGVKVFISAKLIANQQSFEWWDSTECRELAISLGLTERKGPPNSIAIDRCITHGTMK